MAKRAKRAPKTQEQRDEIERDRMAAHEQAVETLDANLPPLPEGVTVVQLDPTPEGMAIMHRALAEAVGEDPLEKHMGDGEGDAIDVEIPSELEATEGEPFVGDDEEPKVVNSIVKDKFKEKYIANAIAMGETKKAAKRSNWDWLAQQLAAACLSEKGKIEIGAFKDILDANGVDHSRWTNQNKGWEGRFRMTGRVALQKVVANAGALVTAGGTVIEAPAEFVEKYKTKA
jgi:hypothetical protein